MSLLSNRRVFSLKVESTYKTDSVPTAAADAIFIESLSMGSEGLRLIERPGLEANIGTRKSIYGGRLISLQVTAEVKGSGAAGTPPEVGPILRACGFLETIVASTSVTYTPASTGHESFSSYIWKDGKLRKVVGIRGNCSFAFEVGNKIMLSANLIGHIDGIDSDVSLPTPTYDTTDPEPILGGGFLVDSYAAVIAGLNFDMGNVISTPPDFNAPTGFSEIRITKRAPNGSINPEDTLIATKNFRADFESATSMALATGNIGATAGNIIAASMPVIGYRDESDEDRDGVSVKNMPFGMHASSGDDEVSLAFT